MNNTTNNYFTESDWQRMNESDRKYKQYLKEKSDREIKEFNKWLEENPEEAKRLNEELQPVLDKINEINEYENIDIDGIVHICGDDDTVFSHRRG